MIRCHHSSLLAVVTVGFQMASHEFSEANRIVSVLVIRDSVVAQPFTVSVTGGKIFYNIQ